MIIERQEDVTTAVLAVMEQTHDPRLREIMILLVKHLHGFVREARLTEKEFHAALAIVNEIGQATTDTHNEASLMAGSLGVSPLHASVPTLAPVVRATARAISRSLAHGRPTS